MCLQYGCITSNKKRFLKALVIPTIPLGVSTSFRAQWNQLGHLTSCSFHRDDVLITEAVFDDGKLACSNEKTWWLVVVGGWWWLVMCGVW
jgi:hypothetical protein